MSDLYRRIAIPFCFSLRLFDIDLSKCDILQGTLGRDHETTQKKFRVLF